MLITSPTQEFIYLNNHAANIKRLRKKIGLTQKACAERFGYALRTWQAKEQEASAENSRPLSDGEFELLLLLAGEHPSFTLKEK